MPLYVGTDKIDPFYVGNDKIIKAYVGDDLVYHEKQPVQIYGAYWDGTSTTKWTRTDAAENFPDPVPYVAGATSYGSPFDNIMPWAGMVKSERTGGTMVAIPKFWYKLEQVGAGMKIQIANEPLEGFVTSPAHMDRGDGKGERDVVYIGRYHCASDYKSKTQNLPKTNIYPGEARTGIHSLGENIWQLDFATRFAIWLLYLVEFADWNSQEKIGYGCSGGTKVVNVGYTDSMPYHTGTTLTDRKTYGCSTQYRNIEGLWENVLNWCDGCTYNSSGMVITVNPNNFSSVASTGVSVGLLPTGKPSSFRVTDSVGFLMFLPVEAASSNYATYTCDDWTFNTSWSYILVGGRQLRSLAFGLFFVSGTNLNNALASDRGARIMELP